jgi:hypothetical protein
MIASRLSAAGIRRFSPNLERELKRRVAALNKRASRARFWF